MLVTLVRPPLAAALVLALAGISAAGAEKTTTQIVIPAETIVWGPAPPSVPRGARAVTLYGDPGKDGLFAMRLKVPKGYVIPPHTHPAPEIVTVLSGVVRVGTGSEMTRAGTRPLATGSFYSTEPGTKHFVIIDQDAVLQVNSRGPWGIHYLNSADDPRNKAR